MKVLDWSGDFSANWVDELPQPINADGSNISVFKELVNRTFHVGEKKYTFILRNLRKCRRFERYRCQYVASNKLETKITTRRPMAEI